jgi:hypothetical protein
MVGFLFKKAKAKKKRTLIYEILQIHTQKTRRI